MFKKLDRYGNTLSRNTQPLRVIIVHRLFLVYCTNFVIFQTETKKGIFICGHIGLVQEPNSLILQYISAYWHQYVS